MAGRGGVGGAGESAHDVVLDGVHLAAASDGVLHPVLPEFVAGRGWVAVRLDPLAHKGGVWRSTPDIRMVS